MKKFLDIHASTAEQTNPVPPLNAVKLENINDLA